MKKLNKKEESRKRKDEHKELHDYKCLKVDRQISTERERERERERNRSRGRG